MIGSSFQDLPEITGCPTAGCQYLYEYGGGGSTRGNLATDTVTFGNASVPSLGFGCGHNNTGFAGLDGIVGLGQGPLSLISQLSNAGVISKRFSYCLVSYSSQNSSPLLLGDLAVTSAPPGVAYTPIQANPVYPTYYYLHLDGISVAGIRLKYPPATFAIDSSGNGGLILDSGTTITYLATDAYNAVLEVLKKITVAIWSIFIFFFHLSLSSVNSIFMNGENETICWKFVMDWWTLLFRYSWTSTAAI